MGRRELQPAGARPPPRRAVVERRGRAARAPPRSRPEAGGGRAAPRRLRARRARGGDRAPRRRHARDLARSARHGRGPPRRRPAAAARDRRGLSGPHGERELPRPHAQPHRGRGADPVRAPLLQRRGEQPQHPHRPRSPTCWWPGCCGSGPPSTSSSNRDATAARTRPAAVDRRRPGRRTHPRLAERHHRAAGQHARGDRDAARAGGRRADPPRPAARLPDPLRRPARPARGDRLRGGLGPARRPRGAARPRETGERRAHPHRRPRGVPVAGRVHLRHHLSHRPAARLLRRSRRAVLERDGQRLGLPDRRGERTGVPARQHRRRLDRRRGLHRAAGRTGARLGGGIRSEPRDLPQHPWPRAPRRPDPRRELAEGSRRAAGPRSAHRLPASRRLARAASRSAASRYCCCTTSRCGTGSAAIHRSA